MKFFRNVPLRLVHWRTKLCKFSNRNCRAAMGSVHLDPFCFASVVHHGDKSISERLLKFTAVGKLMFPMIYMFTRFS